MFYFFINPAINIWLIKYIHRLQKVYKIGTGLAILFTTREFLSFWFNYKLAVSSQLKSEVEEEALTFGPFILRLWQNKRCWDEKEEANSQCVPAESHCGSPGWGLLIDSVCLFLSRYKSRDGWLIYLWVRSELPAFLPFLRTSYKVLGPWDLQLQTS